MFVGAITTVLAASTNGGAAEPTNWQETISWAIGLPAAIVGAIASIYLIPKFRLENRKTALEIAKMEREAAQGPGSVAKPGESEYVPVAFFDSKRVQNLVLRFIFLYLVLQAWSLVNGLFGAALSSAQLGIENSQQSSAPIVTVLGYVVLALVASIPAIVSALLFVAIGWPMVLDIARLLNITLPEWLGTDSARRVLIAVAILAACGANAAGFGITAYYRLRGF